MAGATVRERDRRTRKVLVRYSPREFETLERRARKARAGSLSEYMRAMTVGPLKLDEFRKNHLNCGNSVVQR